MQRTPRVVTAFFVVVAIATFLGASEPAGQIFVGDMANWADKSTWSRPDAASRQTETGMGLVADGPSGAMRLAFYVTQSTRRPARPTSVGIRLAASARVNPNLLRTPTLVFSTTTINEDDEVIRDEIDLSTTLVVDIVAPGAAVTSGLTTISAETFIAIAEATEIDAKLLGADVTLREDQIDAIRAFRDRVLPEEG